MTGLVIAIGHDPRSEPFAGQLALDNSGYIKVQAPTTATNLLGVFAAGDVVDHTYCQATTADSTAQGGPPQAGTDDTALIAVP